MGPHDRYLPRAPPDEVMALPSSVIIWETMSSNGTAGLFINQNNHEQHQIPQDVKEQV